LVGGHEPPHWGTKEGLSRHLWGEVVKGGGGGFQGGAPSGWVCERCVGLFGGERSRKKKPTGGGEKKEKRKKVENKEKTHNNLGNAKIPLKQKGGTQKKNWPRRKHRMLPKIDYPQMRQQRKVTLGKIQRMEGDKKKKNPTRDKFTLEN